MSLVNASNGSCKSPSKASCDSDMEDLPLIWEKVSDMIFKYINDRFENVISEYWLKERIKC